MKSTIQRYLRHLSEAQGVARNTLLAYRTDILQFEEVLSAAVGRPIRPEDLTRELVGEYAAWLTHEAYQPSTISRKMAAVRSFLGFMDASGELAELPYRGELRAPSTPRSQPRILTPEEISRLLKAPARDRVPRGTRDAAILELLYATGLRASEAVKLDVVDLDLSLERVRRADREQEWLPLGTAAPALKRYMAAGRPFLARTEREQALFLNLRGQRLSRQGLWLVVKRWSKVVDLGEGVSPHSLRHSMVHHRLVEGATKGEVQRLLGLSSPNAIRIKIDRSE